MAILKDLARDADTLNDSLAETQRLLNLGRTTGSPRPARGASVTDVGRIRGEIQGLGRKIDSLSTDSDPFLSTLFPASPRKAQ